MVARMSICDRRQLELALADLLLPAQSDELSQHLQDCSHCRAELEQLAGGGQWWSEARTFLSSSDELVAADDSQAAGTLRVPLSDGTRSVPTTVDDESSLHFLTPSDQPGMLGRLGNYEIEEVVGRGGMGIVLKAQDPALDRRVAIKVLAGHLSASAAARKRFAYEAKAAAAVAHDHIIPIHAVDTSSPTPFLVMPFVTGRSLQDRLDERGILETREVLRIAMQTAEGLAAAHAQGLVHRDIKPANILLENGCERVRITDFGLARAVDDASQTQSGFIAGTPQYMAPEQARGEPIDARADLFSLGSVMYAMCTGRPPFRAETTLAVLRRICDDEARDVRVINPDVPPWLAAIVEKLLAKSPTDRFQTAAEVADLLKQWLAHLAQPMVILPPKLIQPTARKPAHLARIQPWIAGVGVASTVLAGGLLMLWINGLFSVGSAGPAEPRASVASPLAAAVPPGRRGLHWQEEQAASIAAEQELIDELSHAQQQILLLEAEAFDSPAGASISQELAELDERVRLLELEVAPRRRTDFQSVPGNTDKSPDQPADGLQSRPTDR